MDLSFNFLLKPLDTEFQQGLVLASAVSCKTLTKGHCPRESNLKGFKVITSTRTLLM